MDDFLKALAKILTWWFLDLPRAIIIAVINIYLALWFVTIPATIIGIILKCS